MITKDKTQKYFLICLVIIFVCACQNTKHELKTLADIDIESTAIKNNPKENIKEKPKFHKEISKEEIRNAYRSYVESAIKQDSSRKQALTRLTQLELDLNNELEQPDKNTEDLQSLERTVNLLEKALRNSPGKEGNDKLLYQLAQAYDRTNKYQKSIETLKVLAENFHTSPHYSEAQFRIAENSFAKGGYLTAEDAYTEVILTPSSEKFYEKSLFKRGWTRYKQQLYLESLDDYVAAIKYHNFEAYDQLSDAEKSQFSEYIRALALIFFSQKNQVSITDFFLEHHDFEYQFEVYESVSNLFLETKRNKDALASLDTYIQSNRSSVNIPLAESRKIEILKSSGKKLSSILLASIEKFYTSYNPNSPYWKTTATQVQFNKIQKKLQEFTLQISAYYHSNYQQKRGSSSYTNARRWYLRYLEHFRSYAHQNNIYTSFSNLLLEGNEQKMALTYLELAAYDENIILDKQAAYSSITLLDKMVSKTGSEKSRSDLLDKYFKYTLLFIELYPKDKLTARIATSTAEKIFKAKRYSQAITIANAINESPDGEIQFNLNNIKARSYLAVQNYTDAESIYVELMNASFVDKRKTKVIKDSLALSIYRQGEKAMKEKNIDLALSHFLRIENVAPQTELAQTGHYDAISYSISTENWNQSIALIEHFKRLYPNSKYTADVTKKLSVAYLKSDNKEKAAREFELLAKFDNNIEVKMTALWQAAELYESKADLPAAIRTYRDFANTYKKPYGQNIEAMFKLIELYTKTKNISKSRFWQRKIANTDRKIASRNKTERTNFIASTTVIELARKTHKEFLRLKLVEPIAKNLKIKKQVMQESVKLYGQATSYSIESITTESTHAIGDIYLNFSQALLKSERPKKLNKTELEQYNILLEDQAFPFEEKAIEFYETNLARTGDDIYNEDTEKSLNRLITLFPVRYDRKGRLDVYQ